MSDEASYNEFLTAFGVSSELSTDDSKEPETTTESSEPNTETNQTTSETETKKTEDESKPPEGDSTSSANTSVPEKSSQAFAQMRVENKRYQNMMKGIAEVLGVQDTNNPDNMLASLQELVTKAQAQKQGVPTEVLQRLQQLEQRDQEYTSNQIRQAAYLGFQKVKDTFNLSDNDLGAFADSLVADGLNPFERQIDLLAEYKLRNFEKLLSIAEERGIQKEAERAAKASSHGTIPSKTQGKNNAGAEKITSVSELNKWFDNQTK